MRSKRKTKVKQHISFFMCFILLTSLFLNFPFLSFNKVLADKTKDLILAHDGVEIEEIHLSKNDSFTIDVNGEYSDYQWQIFKVDDSGKHNGFWVSIQGCTGSSINITYALVRSMLNSNNTAKIRARVKESNVSEFVVSEPVNIIILEDEAERSDEELPASTESSETPMQLFSLKNPEPIMLLNSDIEPIAQDGMEYVTITINYDFRSGGQAFDSYVATLVKGTAFETTVISPTILGYEAVKENESGIVEDASEISIDYSDGVYDNVVINVIYQPALVNYIIRYFFQNIFDDLYSENTSYAIMDAKGYTGDNPDSSYFEREYEGYSALNLDRDEISADGSSEYHMYYNRNYYLLNFNLSGGYGVEPIYAKYESSFVINTPIKHGYMFIGWDLLNDNGEGDGVADNIVSTIPAKNLSYKALWKAENTTYQVVYWKENPDDSGYSYWGRETIGAVSSYPVDGQDRASVIGLDDYKYFEYNDDLTDKGIIVDGDGSTVINVYYTRKVYTLKFYYAKSITNDTTTTHYVAGGSTWAFATCGSTDIATMLNAVGSWGAVQSLPELNNIGKSRNYTTGSESYNNQTYYYIQFSGKYDSDISEIWPVGVFDSVATSQTNDFGDTAYFSAWNVEHHTYYSENNGNKTLKGNYLRLDYKMLYDAKFEDVDTVRFLAFWENGANDIGWNKPNKWYYKVYLPTLNNDIGDKVYNDINYNLYATYELYDNNTDAYPYEQTATAIEGFQELTRVASVKEVLDSNYGIYAYIMDFYYTRNNYTLEFTNYGKVDKINENIPYETPLADYAFTPEYPSTLESGAYEFGGWYTSPGCYDGTEVDWETITMPASDLMLYAKWTPKEHSVKVYETYADAIIRRNLYAEFNVIHRNVVNPPSSFVEPSKSGYSFNGWFYIEDNGEKVAFNFQDFAVTKDLIVFADWSSDIIVSYEVNYVFIDANGTRNTIADKTVGNSFAGSTKTFKAKAMNELYDSYTTHYYPRTNNHSIFMDLNSSNNNFTFEYIYLEKVPYTVRYINKITGEELMDEKSFPNNESSVVSEKFEYIKDFVPDAYYKRLVLSANPDENIITFYYVPDSVHAYYAVRHYIQNTDGNGYSEYAVIEGVGDIGTDIEADLLSISGFTYNSNKSTSNGKIIGEGLLLELYYDRNIYSYTVNYLEHGTNKVLSTAKTGSDRYGNIITENAISIDGYNLTGESSVSIEIKDNSSLNTINFYYSLPEITIQYRIVVEGGVNVTDCTVSMSQEVVYYSSGIKGSKPIINGNNYKFVGWYTDALCLNEVNGSLVETDNTLTPPLTTAVYYAKFIPTKASLKISNTSVNTTIDMEQTFLYLITGITGSATEDISLTVAVKGNDSVIINDLPLGEYVITEISDWSFRYTPDAKTKNATLSDDGQMSTVTFTEDRTSELFLDGNAYRKNYFT